MCVHNTHKFLALFVFIVGQMANGGVFHLTFIGFHFSHLVLRRRRWIITVVSGWTHAPVGVCVGVVRIFATPHSTTLFFRS